VDTMVTNHNKNGVPLQLGVKGSQQSISQQRNLVPRQGKSAKNPAPND
jgi:hypothetical protein